MKPGPKPKPTALKIAQGNPGHRPLPKNEPRPRVAAPSMPDFLDAGGRAEWRRVVPILLEMGLLTKMDRAMHGGMATVVGRIRPDPVLENGVKFVLLSHNTKLGAAKGACLVAEYLVHSGLA